MIPKGLLLGCFLLATACHPAQKRPPADAPAAKVIQRAMYTVTYPADWKLDEKDEDFDLDNYFSIDSPGACNASFFLFDTKIDPQAHLRAQQQKQTEMLFKSAPTVTPFKKWGALDGAGIDLYGGIKPVGKAHMRSFAHAEEKRSVVTIEFCFDDEAAAAQPAFDQIERSFRFK